MITLLLKTKSKNDNGVSILLEQESENFYGFRYENQSLKWGYNVNDCGTKQDVTQRIERLINLTKEFIESHKSNGYETLTKWQQDELNMYNEMYEYLVR